MPAIPVGVKGWRRGARKRKAVRIVEDGVSGDEEVGSRRWLAAGEVGDRV